MTKYKYKMVPVDLLYALCAISEEEIKMLPHLQDMPMLGVVSELLESGYRWVQSTGDFAVLELAIKEEEDVAEENRCFKTIEISRRG